MCEGNSLWLASGSQKAQLHILDVSEVSFVGKDDTLARLGTRQWTNASPRA
jgi:hypothetical protein